MWRLVTILVGAIFVQHAQSHPILGAEARNVIWVQTDDLSAAATRGFPMPNLARLADMGTVFTQLRMPSNTCMPSRAGTFTGLDPRKHFGIYKTPSESLEQPNVERQGLPPSAKTIGEFFSSAGFVTGIVGKWHLGSTRGRHPWEQGFDYSYVFLGGGHKYLPRSGALLDNGVPRPFTTYITDEFTTRAVGFIRAHQRERFFLTVQYNAPHEPLQAKAEDIARCSVEKEEQIFCGMLVAVDRGIGEIFDALRETGNLDDTLLIYTADNGCRAGGFCFTGLRGYKGQPWEGGVRVPGIIAGPGLPRGVSSAVPVSGLDILPTTLAAAGVATGAKFDGIDIFSRQTTPDGDRTFFFGTAPHRGAVVQWPWKLYKEGHQWLLYNLAADPDETTNVAADYQAIFSQLQNKLIAYQASLPPPAY